MPNPTPRQNRKQKPQSRKTDAGEMSLLGHITELRGRLFRSVVAWVLATVVAALGTEWLIGWLVRPLEGINVIVLGPTEAPIIYFQVAVAAGAAVALPYIVFEIYGFLKPGLLPNERRVFWFGIPGVAVLFVMGALFTVQVLVPVSMPVLIGFLSKFVQPTYSLDRYLGFVTTLVMWMGLLFQTPLVIYVIARLGWVTPELLARVRRVVWFLAAVFAAVVTPTTDPVTMLMVTGPFIVLYELGVLLARLAVRLRRDAEVEEPIVLD